jgi:hypothetical protein
MYLVLDTCYWCPHCMDYSISVVFRFTPIICLMSIILKCWSTDVMGFHTKLYLKDFLYAFISAINWNLLWGNYLSHPINKGVVTSFMSLSPHVSLKYLHPHTSSSSANWSSLWTNVILDVLKALHKMWYNTAFN